MLKPDEPGITELLVQIRPLARQNVSVDVDLHDERRSKRPTLNAQRPMSKSDEEILLVLLIMLVT